MLTTLRKENPDSGYVFTTERGTPSTADAINRLVKIMGARAELPFPVHFHMLAADTHWPTLAPIPGRSRTGSATVRSRIRFATPS